jgi:hypothetical protein
MLAALARLLLHPHVVWNLSEEFVHEIPCRYYHFLLDVWFHFLQQFLCVRVDE